MSGDHFLSRWSRLKHRAKKGEPAPAPAPAPAAAPAPAVGAGMRQDVLAAQKDLAGPEGGAAPRAGRSPAEEPLPPLESLTPESDFSPFMREGVDPATRQAALKTLFQDGRFNVMDGLDVYIDDYSKPDPLPAGWLEKLNQVARLGEYREEPDSGPQAQDIPPGGTPPPQADAAEISQSPQSLGEDRGDATADTSAPPSPAPEMKDSPARG